MATLASPGLAALGRWAGLHASVLSLPGMPVDPRPVDQIVAEAFETPPAA